MELAREATAQREVGDGYGSPQECVLLMGQIERAQKLIAERIGLAEEIRVRGERLQRVARYRTANDGSPLSDSIALAEGDMHGAARRWARTPSACPTCSPRTPGTCFGCCCAKGAAGAPAAPQPLRAVFCGAPAGRARRSARPP